MTAVLKSPLRGITESQFLRFCTAASCAPSPDNNQPWAFCRQAESIDVWHCRSRALPSDARDMFSWISLGAAIENIVLAASTERRKLSIAPF